MGNEIAKDITVLSPAEVATTLGVSKKTILRMLRDGRIPGVKVGRRWVIARNVLSGLIDTGSPRIPVTSTLNSAEEKTHDRFYARASYERLLIQQPHIKLDGLFGLGGRFFIVCPNLETAITDEGAALEGWFGYSCRTAGSPVSLVTSAPDGAIRISERTLKELTNLTGEPLNSRDANLLFSQLVGRDFPYVSFVCHPPTNSIVHVSRRLSNAEQNVVEEVYANFSIDLPLEVQIKPTKNSTGEFRQSGRQGDLHLITTRYLPNDLSRELRLRMEEDEDYWSSARQLLWTTDADKIEALPHSFDTEGACLVDSAVWTPGNIRVFLALHRPAIFIMPLLSHSSDFLKSLQISEDELVELARIGRVRFIAPQPVDRYPLGLLSRLCETAPDAVLFSRRLAVATIVDCRQRIPLLYPLANTHERHEILALLVDLERTERHPMARDIFQALIKQLKLAWLQTEYRLQFEGAMGTSTVGFGPVVADLIKRWKGTDIFIETHVAAASIEWASALNATIFPVDTPDYSAIRITELLSSAYAGIRQVPEPSSFGRVEKILSGLLAPVNDANVFDVCSVFDGSTTASLRQLIEKVMNRSVSEGEIDAEIRSINDKVRKYEKRKSRLAWVNASAPAGILSAQQGWGSAAWVPWAIWISGCLLTMAQSKPSGWLGWLANSVESGRTLSSRDAVLVSKIRRDLK